MKNQSKKEIKNHKTTDNTPWIDAIQKVLQDSGIAMHYADIAQAIIDQKLRKDVGATPATTVNSNIRSSLKDVANSPFEFVDRGIYKLNSRTNPTPNIQPAKQNTEEDSAGIIQAFGMFWRRDFVHWTNSPKLLGQQQEGANEVNLFDQRGVYLLHDGQRVVYVGQIADRALGKRLYEHTKDRLNGRWDRFSWFGIREVNQDGVLTDIDPKNITLPAIITAFEAILIEGLEPPQNRRRGDDFRAVEYLQIEDSYLIKLRKNQWHLEEIRKNSSQQSN